MLPYPNYHSLKIMLPYPNYHSLKIMLPYPNYHSLKIMLPYPNYHSLKIMLPYPNYHSLKIMLPYPTTNLWRSCYRIVTILTTILWRSCYCILTTILWRSCYRILTTILWRSHGFFIWTLIYWRGSSYHQTRLTHYLPSSRVLTFLSVFALVCKDTAHLLFLCLRDILSSILIFSSSFIFSRASSGLCCFRASRFFVCFRIFSFLLMRWNLTPSEWGMKIELNEKRVNKRDECPYTINW